MTVNRWETSPRPSTNSSTAQWITPAGAGRGEGKRYDSGMARQPHAHALMVVIEPAEGAWRAYCPVLLDYGAAIWGATREEALDHIREVVGMVVARMAKDGASIPLAPAPGATGHELVEPGAGAGERIVITVRVPPLGALRQAPA
jgi:predicted RNase H-like HicB family nuclease